MLLEVIHIAPETKRPSRKKDLVPAAEFAVVDEKLPLHKNPAYLRRLKMDFVEMHNQKIRTKNAKEAISKMKAL